jgi:hypothetical protein
MVLSTLTRDIQVAFQRCGLFRAKFLDDVGVARLDGGLAVGHFRHVLHDDALHGRRVPPQ